MPRDGRATRTRLLEAATAEFAAFGIAGARVDRLAASAGCNKTLIYVHFQSKEKLFEAVFHSAVEEILAAVPFTADDLPGYAGALFDFHSRHPHLMRLSRWHCLEYPGRARQLPIAAEANRAKLRALSAAQATGEVDAGLPPAALLSLVVSIACTWTDGAPDPIGPDTDPETVAARRHAVVVTVGRLTRPSAA